MKKENNLKKWVVAEEYGDDWEFHASFDTKEEAEEYIKSLPISDSDFFYFKRVD